MAEAPRSAQEPPAQPPPKKNPPRAAAPQRPGERLSAAARPPTFLSAACRGLADAAAPDDSELTPSAGGERPGDLGGTQGPSPRGRGAGKGEAPVPARAPRLKEEPGRRSRGGWRRGGSLGAAPRATTTLGAKPGGFGVTWETAAP